jgi:hypothetical protein
MSLLSQITRGKTMQPPRILLLGVEKIGKSSWGSQAPEAVFVPVKGEQGLDRIDCRKFPVAGSFADVMGCLTVLATEEHIFGTVVVDSTSALEPLVWERTCEDNKAASIEKVGGGFGKGYVEALKYWRQMQAALDLLREQRGMAVILIGHVKVKTFNDPLTDPYDTYTFDLQDRAANLLYRWADAILFANYKTYARTVAQAGDKKTVHAVGGTERAVFTEKRPAHPGGNRYSLPYELPFSFAAFQAALAVSCAA